MLRICLCTGLAIATPLFLYNSQQEYKADASILIIIAEVCTLAVYLVILRKTVLSVGIKRAIIGQSFWASLLIIILVYFENEAREGINSDAQTTSAVIFDACLTFSLEFLIVAMSYYTNLVTSAFMFQLAVAWSFPFFTVDIMVKDSWDNLGVIQLCGFMMTILTFGLYAVTTREKKEGHCG